MAISYLDISQNQIWFYPKHVSMEIQRLISPSPLFKLKTHFEFPLYLFRGKSALKKKKKERKKKRERERERETVLTFDVAGVARLRLK